MVKARIVKPNSKDTVIGNCLDNAKPGRALALSTISKSLKPFEF